MNGSWFPVEELEFAAFISLTRLQFVQNARVDDSRKKVIQDYVLVVEPDKFLNFLELHTWIVSKHTVMESQEEPLELRNDTVFVVPGITDESTPWIRVVARQIPSFRIAALEFARPVGMNSRRHIHKADRPAHVRRRCRDQRPASESQLTHPGRSAPAGCSQGQRLCHDR